MQEVSTELCNNSDHHLIQSVKMLLSVTMNSWPNYDLIMEQCLFQCLKYLSEKKSLKEVMQRFGGT